MKLVALFDVKASAYSPPLCFETAGLAIRFLEDECSRPDSRMAKHPADFDLREIGTYDTSNASITSLKTPHVLAKASDFVKG